MKEKDSEQVGTEIYINRAMCVLCGDIVVSLNRHHLKFCKCGSIHVDGGSAYLKRGGEPDNMIEMSVLRRGEALLANDKANSEKFLRWAVVMMPRGFTPYCPFCGEQHCDHLYNLTLNDGEPGRYEFATDAAAGEYK